MNQFTVEKIVDDLINLTTNLRTGNGLDTDLASEIASELHNYAEQNSDKDYVPKAMAEVFLDTFPSIESFASYYDETVAKNIRQVSDMIGAAIREVLSS